jgi:hypothetical protein
MFDVMAIYERRCKEWVLTQTTQWLYNLYCCTTIRVDGILTSSAELRYFEVHSVFEK